MCEPCGWLCMACCDLPSATDGLIFSKVEFLAGEEGSTRLSFAGFSFFISGSYVKIITMTYICTVTFFALLLQILHSNRLMYMLLIISYMYVDSAHREKLSFISLGLYIFVRDF